MEQSARSTPTARQESCQLGERQAEGQWALWSCGAVIQSRGSGTRRWPSPRLATY